MKRNERTEGEKEEERSVTRFCLGDGARLLRLVTSAATARRLLLSTASSFSPSSWFLFYWTPSANGCSTQRRTRAHFLARSSFKRTCTSNWIFLETGEFSGAASAHTGQEEMRPWFYVRNLLLPSCCTPVPVPTATASGLQCKGLFCLCKRISKGSFFLPPPPPPRRRSWFWPRFFSFPPPSLLLHRTFPFANWLDQGPVSN